MPRQARKHGGWRGSSACPSLAYEVASKRRSDMEFHEYLKTRPKREQERFWRGNRLFKYIIEKRCQQPEMLGKKPQKAREVAGK
ncbi:MAG: hypothetical protein MJE68_16680 [Proteobacteria bacterium]|nr:hypothetical protein [Pseudomonadota bacterium]